jgi:hypothetical protein
MLLSGSSALLAGFGDDGTGFLLFFASRPEIYENMPPQTSELSAMIRRAVRMTSRGEEKAWAMTRHSPD